MTLLSLGRRLRRIRAIARVETLRLVRDRMTLSLIAVVPALQIALFGYAIDLDPRGVPIAIAGDSGAPDEPVRRLVRATGYFTVVADRLPSGAAERMVAAGTALVGIELPPPLDDERAPARAPPRPRVVVDATDPTAVRPALAALETAYWQHRAAPFSLDDGAAVDVDWLYNPERRTPWTIVPGLVGVIVMISMLMLGALSLVRERERGTWETLLATPVGALDALVGKLLPHLVIGAAQGAVVVALAHALFGLPVTGSVGALLVVLPLFAATHLILGFAVSALAESQLQAMQGAVFFYLPSILLSGFMFPFQGMPGWARAIGEALPLTHFVRAARGALLKGEGAGLVLAEMWPVAAFALLAAALALAAYRRRLD
jgi:ABC-2 type transport system permease protein